MEALVFVGSILVLTALGRAVNRVLPFAVCSICAGVSLTWLWVLVGSYTGLLEARNWQLLAVLGMGGSVVGIAYQAEKYLAPGRSVLAWKTFFIPAGFTLVYGLLNEQWLVALLSSVAVLAVVFAFLRFRRRQNPASGRRVAELEKKMEDCC